MVRKSTDASNFEALLWVPSRSFRRYNLIFKDGAAQFVQDPICKAFDEIIEELYGPIADQDQIIDSN
jgi:hypothetical protein